ncbi:MAG: tetratricopeptide repeat protein [Candidatus Promineifilaceae bacterium]|jgi:Tfp pilus assembly protein PilF
MNEEEALRQEAEMLRDKGYKHQMAGELADAILYYKKSLAIYPLAETYTFLGWVYSMIDLYDDAKAMCKKAIDLDSGLGNPYNDIGAYLIEQNRWEEAIPWLEEATKAPRYETLEVAYTNLGRVYEHLGDYYLGLLYYNRALATAPLYLPAERARTALLGKLN